MKLYVVHLSNNCRKVVATQKHLGVACEIVPIDFQAGDTRKPEYLKVNPNGMVPAFADGDFHLFESNAIMMYLCGKKPGQTLFPEDAQKRADVARWLFWDAAHFGQAAGTLAYENFIKPSFFKKPSEPALVKDATARFNRFAPVLNAQLETRKFVCGDSLTLADFALAGSLMYAEKAELPVDGYHHMVAWRKRMDEVPAWAETGPKPGDKK